MDAFDDRVRCRFFYCRRLADNPVAIEHFLELTSHEFLAVIMYDLVRLRIAAEPVLVESGCRRTK